MKIIKYEKKKNDKYKLFLEDNEILELYENVIIDNNLLYKKEIDDDLYHKLQKENQLEDNYQNALKYISIRLRSINEVKDYLKKKNVDDKISLKIIDRLIKNGYLNDLVFAKAFVNDKLNFTSSGELKIENELKKLKVADDIINSVISDIDKDKIRAKINKIIDKDIKANHKYQGFMLKNKIYNHLFSLGYMKSDIISELNNYDF